MYTLSSKQQLAIAGGYLALVLLGSAAGHLQYFGGEGSHYFATRGNILNLVFVKRGWMWFTLVFWASHFGKKYRSTAVAARRYIIATVCWIFYAQWFFGPPFMDRIFTNTGGECVLNTSVNSEIKQENSPETSMVCRKTGGLWLGGHDPSGHVFLIVLSSLCLLLEVIPSTVEQLKSQRKLNWAYYIVYALLSLWAFMLFITSVYFHTLAEKVSGFLFAVIFAKLAVSSEVPGNSISNSRVTSPSPVTPVASGIHEDDK